MTVDPIPRRDEEAIGWFVLLRDEDSTEEDRRRFRLWLDADPANARAWREVGLLWDGLAPQQTGAPEGAPDAMARGFAIPSTATRVRPASEPAIAGFSSLPHAGRPDVRRRIWQGLAFAASLAGLGLYLLPPGLMADHRAGIGHREIVLLDDGSEVELGTGAALDVDFTEGRRTVHLITGEAFFTVTPDPDRPFVVQAGDGQVVVRGTAFNLRIDDQVHVTVVEHSVAISAGSSAEILVSEGEEARFSASGVSPVTRTDGDAALAWRRDRLIFVDSPLAAVLDEIGRYRHGYVSLIGSGLADLRVTAVFDTRDPDSAIETIASSLGLRIRRASNLLVVLSRN